MILWTSSYNGRYGVNVGMRMHAFWVGGQGDEGTIGYPYNVPWERGDGKFRDTTLHSPSEDLSRTLQLLEKHFTGNINITNRRL